MKALVPSRRDRFSSSAVEEWNLRSSRALIHLFVRTGNRILAKRKKEDVVEEEEEIGPRAYYLPRSTPSARSQVGR